MSDLGSDVTQILDADLAADDNVRIPLRKSATPGWLYATASQIAIKVASLLFGSLVGHAGEAVLVNGTEDGFEFGAGGGGGGGSSDVVAKALLQWDSAGVLTIATDENVASVTRLGTGNFTVTFTSAIPADCVVLMHGRFGTVASTAPFMILKVDNNPGLGLTTTDFTFAVSDMNTPADPYTAGRSDSWVYFEIKDPTVASGGGGGGSAAWSTRIDFDGTVGTYTVSDAELQDYDTIEIEAFGRCSDAASLVNLNININGVTTAGHNLNRFYNLNNAGYAGHTTLDDLWFINGTGVGDANRPALNWARIYGCRSGYYKQIEGGSGGSNGGGTGIYHVHGIGEFPVTAVLSSITITATAGNLETGGYFIVRGIPNV